MTATSNFPFLLDVVDVIPENASGETAQNSEPSIAVDPIDPTQIWAASFGVQPNPYFVSADGGDTWSIVGSLRHNDTSMAWKVDGSAVLVATMIQMNPNGGPLMTHESLTQINQYVGSNQNDQPWIRTGPADHVYIAYNDLGNFGVAGGGKTASVLVSTDGGNTNRPVTLDRVGTTLQDGPAVRLAVNGNTVYSVFDRWTNQIENSANGSRYNSQLVVVRSDNGGADNFTALGSGGNGVTAATHIAVFSNPDSRPPPTPPERSPRF